MVDASELGDGKILDHTVITQVGNDWFATYSKEGKDDIVSQFAERPKGQMVSDFCEHIRRVVGEREASEIAETRRQAAASIVVDEREDVNATEPETRRSPVTETGETLKEELEGKLEATEESIAAYRRYVEDSMRAIEIFENEKTALKAALEKL